MPSTDDSRRMTYENYNKKGRTTSNEAKLQH